MSIGDEPKEDKRKRPPFAAIPHAVLDVGLSAYEIAAFVAITRFANVKGEAFPSMATIAKTGGMSVSTAKRAVQVLVERGLLSVKQRRDECGDLASNWYVISEGVGSIGTNLGSIGTNGRFSGNQRGRVYRNQELDTEVELDTKNKTSAAKAATRSKKSGCEVPIPEALDTPEFKEQWQAWITHLRESRKSLSKTSAESQLSELSEWGLDRAVAAIRHSIRKGYKGIYEPNGASSGRRPAEPSPGVKHSNVTPSIPGFGEL